MPVLWEAIFIFMVHSAAVSSDQHRGEVCRGNRDEFGFALVGHDYKSSYADNVGRCFFLCSSDERCQSATFFWNTKDCKMNRETKASRPADLVKNPSATYIENYFRAKKGSTSLTPGSSCKDILISGDAQGDGKYWMDPAVSGDPFIVFCDMTTAGGGWLLVSRFVMKAQDSFLDNRVESNSYRTILPNFNSNKQFLLRNGFSQLKQDTGFTQIRFYCFKKTTGRVFHIMTNNDAKGSAVLTFFTSSDNQPEACGSFTRLADDNSTLAARCDKWGFPSYDTWGHTLHLSDLRLFDKPAVWRNTIRVRFASDAAGEYDCDGDGGSLSLGDTWQVFVR